MTPRITLRHPRRRTTRTPYLRHQLSERVFTRRCRIWCQRDSITSSARCSTPGVRRSSIHRQSISLDSIPVGILPMPHCGLCAQRARPGPRTEQTKSLLHDCWAVHETAIRTLGVHVVVCFGQDAGRWVRTQLGAATGPAIESYTEDNGRHWRSTTHRGRDGIQVVTLTHPSRADWTNPLSDPTRLVISALARATGSDASPSPALPSWNRR